MHYVQSHLWTGAAKGSSGDRLDEGGGEEDDH